MASSKWWSKETVALVTGGNTGIGFEIVKRLAEEGLSVILTCRSTQNGQKAIDILKQEGLDVVFHQLDITDPDSTIGLSKWVKTQFGGIDILINNAGINSSPLSADDVMEGAHAILQTNYYGTKNVIVAMLPFFRHSTAGNRIINVSSTVGQLSTFLDETWKKQLLSVDTLREDIIESFLQNCLLKFEENLPRKVSGLGVVRADLHFTDNMVFYAISKAALNAYTAMLARDLSKSTPDQKFFVNCMCPGLTSTKMSGNIGHNAEIGADTAVWLALLPASACTTGKFFFKREERSTEYVEELFEDIKKVLSRNEKQKLKE